MSCSNANCLFVRRGFGPLALAALALVAGLSVAVAVAENPAAAGNKPAEKKIPDPEDVDLETKDGVQLQLTYYASNVGKDAIPIILLHGWKGSRADMAGLGLQLQRHGYAVVAPDLRGHGKSTQLKQNGQTFTIDQATMKKDDFQKMSDYDLETVKSFIRGKNNASELNMEKLCVAGYEMGALVAARWTNKDWDWPVLLQGGKQGKDVKALVLIGAREKFKGLKLQAPDTLLSPNFQNDDIAVMFLVGADKTDGTNEATRMYKKLLAMRPRFDPKEEKDKATVLKFSVANAKLEGPNIVADPNIITVIDQDMFWLIENRVANKKTPWAERK